MKKILIFMLSLALVVASCTVDNTTEVDQPTHKWSDNLDKAIETYTGCPEGWESKVVARDYLPSKIFCNRPEMPKDFGDIQTLYELGKITELEKIGPAYYDQPEFFPNFKTQTIEALNAFNPERFGVTIPETYPSAKVFEGVPKGEILHADFLVRSGPLGEKYIWLDTLLIYPAEFNWARNLNKPIEYNPKDADKYFEVDYNLHTFLLEPSFPVWPKDWTKKVDVNIKVKEDAPKGRYAIGITFDHTTNKTLVDNAWFKYGTRYADTMLIKPKSPWYIIYIEVVE